MSRTRVKYRLVRLANGRVVKRRVAMGGLGFFPGYNPTRDAADAAIAAENQQQVACVNQANLDASVKAIDAKQQQLAAAWNPLPTVSVTDLAIVTQTLKTAIAEARASVGTAPRTTSDAESQIRDAINMLDGPYAMGRIVAWEAAIAQARASGADIIEAADLKKSTLRILNHVSNAFMVKAFFECRVDALYRAAQVVDRIVSVAGRVAGAIVELGEKVIKAAGAPLDFIAFLGKYPIIPIGIVGIILFKRFGVKV